MFLALAACSDEATVFSSGPAALEPEASAAAPLYAVSSNVFSADLSEETSFLWLVDDLESGELDLGGGIELPGGASIWGVPRSGVFYVVSAENLTITKYTSDAGTLVSLGELGLAGAGITFLQGEAMAFDGEAHAYFIDLLSAQALELDLEAMVIVRSVDLSSLRLPTAELTFLGDPAFRRRGDQLIGSVYGTSAAFDRVAPEAKILLFDVRTGTFELRASPCAGLTYSVAVPNGDIYFSTDPYVASLFAIEAPGTPAPCLVRLPAGSDELDDSRVALNELTGGTTGGLIPGSDGFAYVRVLDPALYTPAPDATYLEVYSASAWRTWRVNLTSPEGAEPIERPPLAGGIKAFEVDGRAYENESTQSFASTTLVRTTGPDAPARALQMPGVTWGIVRVR
jgi:hypothetical protein